MEDFWNFVGVSVHPSGTVLGNFNLLKYIFVLNICCQQFWAYNQLNIYVGIGYIIITAGGMNVREALHI